MFFVFSSQDLFSINAYVYAQKPQLDIHSFEGTFTRVRLLCTRSSPVNDLNRLQVLSEPGQTRSECPQVTPRKRFVRVDPSSFLLSHVLLLLFINGRLVWPRRERGCGTKGSLWSRFTPGHTPGSVSELFLRSFILRGLPLQRDCVWWSSHRPAAAELVLNCVGFYLLC